MSDDPESANAALVTTGTALADAAVVVIALHGRNQDPTYLVDHLVGPVGDEPAVSWWLPAAPDKSWYPDRADSDSAANDEAIAAAIARLETLRTRLTGTTSAPLVLLGFSQGACLACEFVADHPGEVDAMIALTGGLTGADAMAFRVATLPRPIPAFFAAGDRDPWISTERVRATAAAFAAAGAESTVAITGSDGEHHIRVTEVTAVADLLARLAASPI